MLTVLYAVLAASSNAVGSVLQRKAARDAPMDFAMRFRLLLDLVARPIWLLGIVALICGFIFQAAALSVGDLTLVQPIVISELPLTLLVAGLVFRVKLDRDAWLGAMAVSGGLALVLVSLASHGTGHPRTGVSWLFACIASVLLGGLLVAAAMRFSGNRRAALLGAAAGLGFGFTAALLKGALDRLTHGVGAVVTSWQLYVMAAVGVLSFFLYQNAIQAGTLVAAQPPVCLCDPLAAIGYGVLLFREHLQGGWWIALAVLGAAVILAGSIVLCRSPLVTGHHEKLSGPEGESATDAARRTATADRPATM